MGLFGIGLVGYVGAIDFDGLGSWEGPLYVTGIETGHFWGLRNGGSECRCQCTTETGQVLVTGPLIVISISNS